MLRQRISTPFFKGISSNKIISAEDHTAIAFPRKCTFQDQERNILDHFGYFVPNSSTFQCTFTGLNNAMVYQNLQIRGSTRSYGEVIDGKKQQVKITMNQAIVAKWAEKKAWDVSTRITQRQTIQLSPAISAKNTSRSYVDYAAHHTGSRNVLRHQNRQKCLNY